MKSLLAASASALLFAVSAAAQSGATITVTPAAAQTPSIGSAASFTGVVRVESRFTAPAPARASGGVVSFEAGARTAWHAHPLGQTLIVTAGAGLVQQWDGPIQEIRPGDIVWIPPGVKHWHGAMATSEMTHIAIAEALDGKTVEWMEQVSEEQYRR